MEAFAAALGSADGLEFLAHDCADKKVRVDARVTAAGDMIHLVHKGGCLPAIVAILTSENDVPSDVVVAALNLLRDSFEEGIPVPQTTLNLIAEYLRSEDAGISTHCDWHAFAPGKQ
jgi:hypothetical protein